MNLAELSKLDVKDLQNLDYGRILQELRKKPLVLVNMVLVLGTLVFCQRYYSKKKQESVKASQEVPTLEKKIEAITSYQDTKKELDEFIKSIPPFLAEEDLISFIANLAEKRRIRIQSFSPGKVVNMPMSDRFSVACEVHTSSYKDLWLFIHDLEAAPYALSVADLKARQAIGGNPARRSRNRTPQGTALEEGLSISLEIISVEVKKNAK